MAKNAPKIKTSFLLITVLLSLVLVMCIFALVSMNPGKMVPAAVLHPKFPSDANSEIKSPTQPELVQNGTFDTSKFKSEAEWKRILTPNQYLVLRQAGTETPYTGELLHEARKGTFYSVGCDEPLFRSEQKYDSKTGWPSFWAPIDKDAVVLKADTSIPGEARTEVLDKCGNHLGHVFDDGPEPTGKRFCMNSIALKFVPDPQQ